MKLTKNKEKIEYKESSHSVEKSKVSEEKGKDNLLSRDAIIHTLLRKHSY